VQSFDAGRLGRPLLGGGLALLVLCAAGTAAYSINALSRERRHVEEVTAANQALSTSLRQMRAELGSMSDKLNALSSAPPALRRRQRRQTAVRTPKRLAAERKRAKKTGK